MFAFCVMFSELIVFCITTSTISNNVLPGMHYLKFLRVFCLIYNLALFLARPPWQSATSLKCRVALVSSHWALWSSPSPLWTLASTSITKVSCPYLLGAEKHNTEQQEDKLNMTTCWQLLCCSCRWQREPRHLLHHPDSQCSSLCLLSSGCLSAFLVHFLSFPLTPWCFLFFQQLEFDVALTKEAQHLAQVHEGTGSK